MPAERVILRPMSAADGGTGHVRRCLDLARRLGERALLILDEPRRWDSLVPGIADFSRRRGEDAFLGESPPAPGGALAVFDRRESGAAEVVRWAECAVPLLLDDDGPGRRDAPFLIDTIPGPRRGEANIASPAYLNLPPKVRTPDPGGPVLVSFGGEDPGNLTPAVLRALIEDCGVLPSRITVTRPPGKTWNLPGDNSPAPESPKSAGLAGSAGSSGSSEGVAGGVRVLACSASLGEHLGEFGLVICSYGITLWEALAAGCAVLTVQPTRRHAELARFSGIPGTGLVKKTPRGELSAASLGRLRRALGSPEALTDASLRAAETVIVPEGADVELHGTPILGNVEQKVRKKGAREKLKAWVTGDEPDALTDPEGPPTFCIDGHAILGSIRVLGS